MKENAMEYLRDDQTRRFLLRDVGVAGRENFSRQDAINQVFQPKTHTVWLNGNRNSAYEHVSNRNFESLRNLHEQYYRRPSQYGVSRLHWGLFLAFCTQCEIERAYNLSQYYWIWSILRAAFRFSMFNIWIGNEINNYALNSFFSPWSLVCNSFRRSSQNLLLHLAHTEH